MPIVEWRERVRIDLQRERGHGLVRIQIPELISKRGKQERRRFSGDSRKGQHHARDDAEVAVRNVIERVVRHRETPKPNAASRMACGTSSSICSVVRAIWNHHDCQRHTACQRGKMFLLELRPAHKPQCRSRSTARRSARRKQSHGIPVTVPSIFRQETPAPIPSGTPIRLAIARITPEPIIAFAMPPPASPTGFGSCVKNEMLIEPMPL